MVASEKEPPFLLHPFAGCILNAADGFLSIEDRECFVSGLCHDCQETMFGGMDCEEEEEEARANA